MALATKLMATFDITQFGQNLYTKMREWGSVFIVILGVIMMIVAVYKIGKGLIQAGKGGGQTNWAVAIALLIIGGALASFGVAGTTAWEWIEGIAAGGKNTIDELGGAGGGGSPP